MPFNTGTSCGGGVGGGASQVPSRAAIQKRQHEHSTSGLGDRHESHSCASAATSARATIGRGPAARAFTGSQSLRRALKLHDRVPAYPSHPGAGGFTWGQRARQRPDVARADPGFAEEPVFVSMVNVAAGRVLCQRSKGASRSGQARRR